MFKAGEQYLFSKYLDEKLLREPFMAMSQASKEVNRIAKIALDMLDLSKKALLKNDEKAAKEVFENEDLIDDLCYYAENYLDRIPTNELSGAEFQRHIKLIHAITDIERTADLSNNIAVSAISKINKEKKFTKIAEEEKRKSLKEIMGGLKMPEGFGLIMRTAGEDCTKTLAAKDLRYLLKLWKIINAKGTKADAPALLYKERNLAVRSIRDYFTPDVTEILIDDENVFNEVKSFMHIISPKHEKIVKLHKGAKPLFSKFQLEDQIASIFESRVNLKSGGSIVIQQTEALVSIDVNSGKATQKKSIEQTALQTNVEAAEEVARQLRLRDMGGLIVIDFIDMMGPKNKAEVERTIKRHLKNDKARTNVGRISRFGLMEMSRQRIRPSIEFTSYEPCQHCHGRGLIPSVETLALRILRKLQFDTLTDKHSYVKAILPTEVADYLLNKKRKELLDLETRRNCGIIIEGRKEMLPNESKVTFE